MLSKALGSVCFLLAALAGCDSDDVEQSEDSGAESELDGGSPDADEDAELPDDDEPGKGEATTMDRCLGAQCAPSRLPPQPELTFLEDMGDGWVRLMEADWELAPGTEGYRCMTLTLPQDVYVKSFGPQAPMGTHHSTYGVSPQASGPDGVVACGVTASGTRRLQGSGAGSEPSQLPPGVAMPLRKGEQILMNLHLFNVGAQRLRGRSGLWVKTAPIEEVEVEAEAVLAGPLTLNIPVGRSTQTGTCTMREDTTIYGVSPHMHQTGVHLRATAQTADGEREIYDDSYDFSHQLFHDIEDVKLKKGDQVNIECTYDNTTSRTITWGDSSLDEMCFLGIGLYPAIGYGGLPCSR